MQVILQGKRYSITREMVEQVVRSHPETLQRYAVRIGGRTYPLKQAAAAGIGVPPVAFTSQQAYRWLSNLDFEIRDLKKSDA